MMGIRNWFAASLVGITDLWPRGLGWENLDLQNCTRDGVSSHRARCTPVWNRPNPLVNNMPPGQRRTNLPKRTEHKLHRIMSLWSSPEKMKLRMLTDCRAQAVRELFLHRPPRSKTSSQFLLPRPSTRHQNTKTRTRHRQASLRRTCRFRNFFCLHSCGCGILGTTSRPS